jgi:leucyl-tRNA synthetase
MRYLSPDLQENYIDTEKVNEYLPVDQYIGGIEHAVLHLLYARFMTRALEKIGKISVKEPFKSLFTQGMVCHVTYQSSVSGAWLDPTEVKKDGNNFVEIKTGKIAIVGPSIKMSKSKLNVVDPEEIFERYGADTARWFVLTDTPPDKDIEWTSSGIEASYKFIGRIWTLLLDGSNKVDEFDMVLNTKVRHILYEYTNFLSQMSYNKALAKIYELFNLVQENARKSNFIDVSLKREILICLYPVIPFVTTQIWEELGSYGFLSEQSWPDFSSAQIIEEDYTIAVQILGKMRGTLKVPMSFTQTDIEKLMKNTDIYDKYIAHKKLKKVIFVHGKIINYVVSD